MAETWIKLGQSGLLSTVPNTSPARGQALSDQLRAPSQPNLMSHRAGVGSSAAGKLYPLHQDSTNCAQFKILSPTNGGEGQKNGPQNSLTAPTQSDPGISRHLFSSLLHGSDILPILIGLALHHPAWYILSLCPSQNEGTGGQMRLQNFRQPHGE